MTWPWVLHLRDGVPDPGDPYLNAWIMWWDYYQTFHDPIHLFQAPIFYPYAYTLAYSEHNYGIALLFFPFYPLGLRPLTAAGLATLLGFASSGYGAFRLARTVTASHGIAWVAGIVFGFALYRFATISHLNYLFSAWIPLTLEALILFIRLPSWRRALWLFVAFTMNGLTCVHWFVLTMIPFAISGALLLTHRRQWTNQQLWKRLAVVLLLSGLVLLPFLLPYQRVAKLQGTIRTSADAATYSAFPQDWFAATPFSKVWREFGPVPNTGERHLFPGLLPVLLMVAAFFLSRSKNGQVDAEKRTTDVQSGGEPSRKLVIILDVLAVLALIVAVLAYGWNGIRPFGLRQFHVPDASRPLGVFVAVFVTRLVISYPRALRFGSARNLAETMRRNSEAVSLGLIWTVLGFFGSLGMNFFFHRLLFEYVFIFRSIRVPARWAMMAMLGAALLAGLGAQRIARAVNTHQQKIRPAAVYFLLCVLLLAEMRAAPMVLYQGEVDPDAVSVFLEQTPMRGGVAHLPSGTPGSNQRYVLRQADHRRPLITAFSGFVTPQLREYETLSQSRPIPDVFVDLLEQIPASYLVVHDSALPPDSRSATREMLVRALSVGRLLFVREFPGTGINGNDGALLFAVTKTEPQARAEGPLPAYLAPRELGADVREDPTILVSEFDRWSYPLYLLYKVSFGRMPRYEQFLRDAETTGQGIRLFQLDWEQHLKNNLAKFAAEWTERPEFKKAYAGKSAEEFVDQLYAHAGVQVDETERTVLATRLQKGAETRASVLLKVIGNETLMRQERDNAWLLSHFFGYLRRNPDDAPDNSWDGFNFWLSELEKSSDPARVTRGFMMSGEYQGVKKAVKGEK